jgi:Spy/CpxP family protein refolding chaperone
MKKNGLTLPLGVLTCLLAMALCTPLAFSQAPPPDKQEMMAKVEQMSAALQLTPAQKQQVIPILKEEAPKLQAVKANTSLGPVQKAMQLKQISNTTDAKLKPILTPEQFQKLQQIHEQQRQEMMQKMEQK